MEDMLVDPASRPSTGGAQGKPGARRAGAAPGAEPFRTTLHPARHEGFAYEEVAAIARRQCGTVKSRLVRRRPC